MLYPSIRLLLHIKCTSVPILGPSLHWVRIGLDRNVKVQWLKPQMQNLGNLAKYEVELKTVSLFLY